MRKFVRRRWKIILIAACCIIAVCAIAAGVYAWYARPVTYPSGTLIQQQTFWENEIHKLGGAKAYEVFADSVANFPPTMQHQDAHVFGGALFQVEGTPGLSVCDSRFSFGCFHEFLGEAIASLGLTVVTQLDEDCFQTLGPQGLGCQHGIGHGLLAYLGYSNQDLFKALDICKGLPGIDPIGGCYGGVFMEYNLQTMLGTEGRIRKVENGDMQFPCDSVDTLYKPACYFWQPQWWRQFLRNYGVTDNDAAYAQVGVWCSQAPAAYQRDCYEGIGNNIPADANFDGDVARQLCVDSTSDPFDQLYCRSFAADSLFVGGAGAKGDSMALCEGLSASAYQDCAAYAENKVNDIQLPVLTSAEIGLTQ